MMFVHFISLLLIGQLNVVSGFNTVYKTVGLDCLPNPEYLRNVTCKLKPISWQKSVSSLNCDIPKTIHNFSLHMQIFAKNDANQYQPFLVNVTQNFCDVLTKKIFNPYSTLAANILKQVSNVNHSCPYEGHLVANNLFIDEKYLPLTPPLGFYKFVFRFMEGYPYEDIGTAILYVEAVEKNLRQRVKRPKEPIIALA